jgi:hypothetical protein
LPANGHLPPANHLVRLHLNSLFAIVLIFCSFFVILLSSRAHGISSAASAAASKTAAQSSDGSVQAGMVLFSSAQQLHQDKGHADAAANIVSSKSASSTISSESDDSRSPAAPPVVGDIIAINGQVKLHA